MSFTPSYYSVAGTPQPSRSILQAVIAGSIHDTVYHLVLSKKHPRISWGWEPYNTLTSKAQLDCLKMVLDDPRFDFGPEFLCACSYFTPKALRSLVWNHPRATKWLQAPETFEEAAAAAYMARTGTYNVGLGHRGSYGRNECYFYAAAYRKKMLWRLTFVLYPALKFWIQRRLEDYYAPGGPGFLKAKEHWDAAHSAAAAEAAASDSVSSSPKSILEASG
jgi:hypothetical protein